MNEVVERYPKVRPLVDHDPAGAWVVLSDGIQALLDDPETSARDSVNEGC